MSLLKKLMAAALLLGLFASSSLAFADGADPDSGEAKARTNSGGGDDGR